jgi:hypothetical protein
LSDFYSSNKTQLSSSIPRSLTRLNVAVSRPPRAAAFPHFPLLLTPSPPDPLHTNSTNSVYYLFSQLSFRQGNDSFSIIWARPCRVRVRFTVSWADPALFLSFTPQLNFECLTAICSCALLLAPRVTPGSAWHASLPIRGSATVSFSYKQSKSEAHNSCNMCIRDSVVGCQALTVAPCLLVLPLPDAPGGHRLGVNGLAVDADGSTL